MAQVYLSVGSNIEPEHHIRAGLKDLREHYGTFMSSFVYESKAIGFVGDNFYNLVVGFETTEDAFTLIETLRNIEHTQGRKRQGKSFSARTLDLDLLLYDDLIIKELSIPREDILKYAFVLLPLAEIAPTAKHPLTGQNYAELWKLFDKHRQTLWRVAVEMTDHQQR
jgi:2-amino-4-hydroxy-6-hydroxymethyldihydropteridine diphosphokinase